jgi:hypothetical protein
MLGFDQAFQPRFQLGPLRRVDLDLEYGELDALAKITASFGDAPQACLSPRLGCAHVIGHEHKHSASLSLQVYHFQNHGG